MGFWKWQKGSSVAKNERLYTLLAIVVAYLFSYYFHIHWIGWASQYREFFFGGELMINNPDGYFYGSGAQKILEGLHQYNPRLQNVWGYGTAVITAYVAKYLPVSLDTAMLYLPAVISSLVVIPIILIGRLYGNLLWGFLAALLGSIGLSYYNRTLAGYYDTDMFAAMLPMLILYLLLRSIRHRSLDALLAAALVVIVYPWLYEQGLSIIYAMGLVAFVYLLVTGFGDKFTYRFIILFSFALVPIHWAVKLVLVTALWYLLRRYDAPLQKLRIAAGISVLLFLFAGNVFGIILAKVISYTSATHNVTGLHFLNVSETVREASKIPFEVVANRIIGSTLGLIVAIAGYILLVARHKEFIIALPLWGIGFFAYAGGLRFTVYAVPVAALSAVYFFIWLSGRLKDRRAAILAPFLGTLLLLVPNITHIKGCCPKTAWLDILAPIYPVKSYPYLTPTVMYGFEVELLDRLSRLSSPKDYALTWWDYGYPIWYYAKLNTLVDGGKHNEDNYIVSKILTTPDDTLAANLAKLAVKVYAETNATVAPQIFVKGGEPVNVEEFLARLGSMEERIDPGRDVYIVLPRRMLDIFPTVMSFGARDLNTGRLYDPGFFYRGRLTRQGDILLIGELAVDLGTGMVRIGDRQFPIKRFDIVAFDKSGKVSVRSQPLRDEGLVVLVDQSFDQGIVMDDRYADSLFIRSYYYDDYDRKLFEPVIESPWMKVLKLK